MKKSELRQIIREEVKRAVSEANFSDSIKALGANLVGPIKKAAVLEVAPQMGWSGFGEMGRVGWRTAVWCGRGFGRENGRWSWQVWQVQESVWGTAVGESKSGGWETAVLC